MRTMHLELDKNKIKNGLYIVSTPIGNLKDISLRAIEVLKNSDFILCEDTRVTKKLLAYYKIDKKLISNHKFNEKKNLKKILEMLNNSKILSLVSDAGTPLISDPGNILINECIKNNIKVIPIPGPSAAITAVSVSGFSNNFYFQGFISDKKNGMKKELEFLSKLNNSIVFFISAKKFNKLIPHLKDYFFSRKIAICKDLTKFYEQVYRLNISELSEQNINLKGEITVVISDIDETKKNRETLDESVKVKIKNLINKLTIKDIVSIIGSENNISKSAIYKYCLKLKNEK